MPNEPGDRAGDSNRPVRRPRYRGTHPRGFDERYKELDPESYPEVQDHVRGQGRTPAGTHVPVLLAEVLECLAPSPGDIVADCTVGFGGHAQAILQRIQPGGLLVGLDVDGDELERTAARLADHVADGRVKLHRSHYAGLAKVMHSLGLSGFDVILADLGVSSMQIDNPQRGFSFKYDGPLDMRMDRRLRRTAADWLAALTEEELAAALETCADEPDARRIARAIIGARSRRPIQRSSQLVKIVLDAKRTAQASDAGDLHPAARTFQTLRILVNDELTGLEQFLRIAPYCLRPGGRIGVISFHRGEHDRVEGALRRDLEQGNYASISGEPLRPGPIERRDNSRSASAQLRWARRSPAACV